MANPNGISLHIGLNKISKAHYGPQVELAGCENDARDMAAIAAAAGFKTRKILLTAAAKAKAVLDYIDDATDSLGAGDIFFISYSGHGSQVDDENGGDEEDAQDETWCTYDRMLVDDELYARWAKFAPGVRVIILSDSCHSGSVARVMNLPARYAAMAPAVTRYRYLPDQVARAVVKRHQKMYSDIQKNYRTSEAQPIGASVLLISGCQDNQLSADGDANGLFTEMLKAVYRNGAFRGGYKKFHKAILRKMPPQQTPNFYPTGHRDAVFVKQKPFTV